MANPIYEQTTANYPPYHESALKAALRLIARGGGPGLAGLGAVPRGANFGEALLASAGASARATTAAHQAAQEYALKQQQAQDEQNLNEYRKLDIKSQIEARAKDKPEKTPNKQQDYDYLVHVLHMDPIKARQIVYGLSADEQISQKQSTQKPEAPADLSWLDNQIQETKIGERYINASEIHGKDLHDALVYGAKLGIPVLGSADIGRVHDIDTARANVEDILAAVNDLLPADAAQRIIQYPNIKISQLLQSNTGRSAFKSWRGSAIRTLRATAGSNGLRLNQKEIDLAVANEIPELTDTLPVAQQKMDYVRRMLDNAATPMLMKDWRSQRPMGSSGTSGKSSERASDYVKSLGLK